jgi:hypothetical protein
MDDGKQPRSQEQISNLIDETDRVRDESSKTREWVERAMKRPAFWPDRRNPEHLGDRTETHREESNGVGSDRPRTLPEQ